MGCGGNPKRDCIMVKFLNDDDKTSKYQIKINDHTTSKDIKRNLAERNDLPLSHIRLLFRGKLLNDVDRLRDKGVRAGMTLHSCRGINVFTKRENALMEALREQNRQQEEEKLCIICCEREATHACMPCGHKILCGAAACHGIGGRCPTCRAQVMYIGKIYE